MKKSMIQIVLMALVAGVLPAATAVTAQDVDVDRVHLLVESALPEWGPEMLEVRDAAEWTARLGFNKVFTAMQDQPVDGAAIPLKGNLVESGQRAVTMDRSEGRIRYVNRDRTWALNKDATAELPPKEMASQIVLQALAQLGLPDDEISEIDVVSQMIGVGTVGSDAEPQRYEQYRIVTAQRRIAGRPVFTSRIVAAVTHQGLIQRLLVEWPTFRVQPDFKAAYSRQAVVEQAVAQIMEQDPRVDIEIESALGYAPVPDRDGEPMVFVPAAVFAVSSGETPYMFVVPLAE